MADLANVWPQAALRLPKKMSHLHQVTVTMASLKRHSRAKDGSAGEAIPDQLFSKGFVGGSWKEGS